MMEKYRSLKIHLVWWMCIFGFASHFRLWIFLHVLHGWGRFIDCGALGGRFLIGYSQFGQPCNSPLISWGRFAICWPMTSRNGFSVCWRSWPIGWIGLGFPFSSRLFGSLGGWGLFWWWRRGGVVSFASALVPSRGRVSPSPAPLLLAHWWLRQKKCVV